MTPAQSAALQLAHALGDPANDLCILAEGNMSVVDGDALWIKASGYSMTGMGTDGLVQVRRQPVLDALHRDLSDPECRELLNSARVDPGVSQLPSTETFMHAALLELPGVACVAHSHPTALLSLLSHQESELWARKRVFPDEIVCCGPAACFVPYVAPGLKLAKSIMACIGHFQEHWGIPPKTIWLQNHGLITLGSSAKEAIAASLMQVKAARVLLGAVQFGHGVRFLDPEEVDAIYTWPDEHYRQKRLRGEI